MEKVVEVQESDLVKFAEICRDLLESEEVRSMEQWLHHGKVSCLDHSVAVALTSYSIARKLGLDGEAVARAGLLHDFYLYHKRDKSKHSGLQAVDHPIIAVQNAKKITHLSAKEENIILAHMWPFAAFWGAMPQSIEAHLVNLVDTAMAAVEFAGLSHGKETRLRLYGLI